MGNGQKALAKIKIHLNEREKGKYLTLPGGEQNEFAVFNNNNKKTPLHSLIASNLAFTFLK